MKKYYICLYLSLFNLAHGADDHTARNINYLPDDTFDLILPQISAVDLSRLYETGDRRLQHKIDSVTKKNTKVEPSTYDAVKIALEQIPPKVGILDIFRGLQ